MIDKKYQIFLSSTYRDLGSARDKIIKAILNLYQFPVGMEMFSADDDDQWAVIKKTIETSDYYILIVGHRYGSIRDGVSYTEMEFDYAVEKGVPVMSFIMDRGASTTPSQRDSDPLLLEKLEGFIEKATSNKMCDFWTSEDDLALKVTGALFKAFRKYDRIGWVRGDQVISPEISAEMARLSAENHKLKQELDDFARKASVRRPILKVDFESLTGDEFKYEEDFDFKPVAIERLSEDIPPHLEKYLTLEMIRAYNKALPNDAELEEYNDNLRFVKRLKKYADFINFKITNRGKSPANGVSVKLFFPKDLFVIDADALDDMNIPKLNIPENPKKAAMRKQSSGIIGLINSSLVANPIAGIDSRLFAGNFLPISKPYEVKGFTIVEIEFERLAHTKSFLVDGVKILAARPGDFLIRAEIFCEEFETEEVIEVPLKILS